MLVLNANITAFSSCEINKITQYVFCSEYVHTYFVVDICIWFVLIRTVETAQN